LWFQLAQIPEGYGPVFPQAPAGDDCEKLCREADQLLEKSVATEEAKDLTTALVLCQAAVSKARKAMDAPYHNDKTYCIARLKHTTCVMRMRSLHRRLVSEKQAQGKVANEKRSYFSDVWICGLRRYFVGFGDRLNRTDSVSKQMQPNETTQLTFSVREANILLTTPRSTLSKPNLAQFFS